MRQADIRASKTYTDGKVCRRVISILFSSNLRDGDKVTWVPTEHTAGSPRQRTCELKSFANWARAMVD